MSGASSAEASKKRVKLYSLNATRQWDDKGTGHVTSCYHEPLDGMALLVRNEADGSLLLESKILAETHYQKQQGTLIVWSENDSCDLALSFQERDGCDDIWQKICQVQGKDPSCLEQDHDQEEQEVVKINLVECDHDKIELILEQVTACSQTAKRREALAQQYVDRDYIRKLLNLFRQAEERQDLPTLHKLYEIFKQLFLYDKPTLTEVLMADPFLLSVIGVFEYEPQPEQQKQVDKSPINNNSNNNNNINETDIDFDADTIADIDAEVNTSTKVEAETSIENEVGASIENEAETSIKTEAEVEQHQQQKQPIPESDQQHHKTEKSESQIQQQIAHRKRHREYLQNCTTFKEVIPFSNQTLVDKIHQIYRMQYLQSSVLPTPPILEENAYASVTNILFFHKVEIVSLIQENGEFLQNLFNQIISNETGLDRKRELVQFLKEYCMFSQTIQPKQRESFFKTLASLKILSAVEVALSSNDQVIKSAAIDIFTYLVEYSPHMTREHAVQQKEGIIDPPSSNAQTANILKLVIEHITTDQDPELGTATQLSCIIRLLLDPENMPGDSHSKLSFLEFFYYTCMQSLVEPINNSTTSSGDIEPSANDRKTAQLLSIMLDLLTFFVEHHYHQLRNYIVSSDLLIRIISLIKSRHKFLILSVIRFFRRLLATKDEVYFELVMNEDLFSPIVQVLKNNNGRYNLVDSAILEMFEFIQTEELHSLMNHILTNFGPFLESIDYVNTFKIMRQKKETLHDSISEDPLKPNRSSMENNQIYFSNPSRKEMENIWFGGSGEADVGDVGEVDTDPDKDLDPDSGDATVDSGSDGLNLPELEFTMNGSKNDDDDEDEDVDEDEDDEVDEDEDDIQMEDDELEPQFKRKKTK